jgi:hypothetical protein
MDRPGSTLQQRDWPMNKNEAYKNEKEAYNITSLSVCVPPPSTFLTD